MGTEVPLLADELEPASSSEPQGVMLRLMVMKVVVGVLLVLALAGCGDDRAATASPASDAFTPMSAEPVCAAAAEAWGGTVVGAFPMTVSQVRAFMGDPHGAAANPAAPRPVGAHAYPSGAMIRTCGWLSAR